MNPYALVSLLLALPLAASSAIADDRPVVVISAGMSKPVAAEAAFPKAPAPIPYSLSADARKVSRLLDRGACAAAAEFLWARMKPGSDDAGLRCQYVRFLLLSNNPGAPGFVQTPLGSDHTTYFWVTHVAEDAAALAVDLDPKCRAYLAHLILASLATGLEQQIELGGRAVENDRTIVCPNHDQRHTYTGFELSLVELGWTALRLDRFEAARWAPTFERLLAIPIRKGDVRSAVLLGRLAGDLRQHGRGPEDFLAANRALNTALDSYHGTDGVEDLAAVAEHYQWKFRRELQDIADGQDVDPNFKFLQIRLAEYGEEIQLPQPSKENPAP